MNNMSSEAQKYLNTIFLGEVASVQNYGAFVKIPGGRLQGLIHRTQVSRSDVTDVNDVLQKGDKVWCKAIKITDDGKLSLSMKVVDQGSGKDLDPNGVQIQQDEQRRKERPTGGGRKKIELEAVLNTTCTKCGTRGHIASDCFKAPDGKTYELLPDEEEEASVAPPSAVLPKQKEKKKKEHRKEKKSRKKKKKRDKSSSSSDEDSDAEHRSKKKSKKRRSRSRSTSRKKHKQ